MIQPGKLRKMGYSRQVDRLQDMLYQLHKEKIDKERTALLRLGFNINYSYYERYNKTVFTEEEVIEAFEALNRQDQYRAITEYDICWKYMKGKKWWQFWKNDFNEKLIKCLELI